MSLTQKTINFISKECNCSLTGKTVLITGANSGVGFKTAETMIYLGAAVIMACRNQKKAEEARNQLLADYPAADIKIMTLDIADLSSIDAFVKVLPEVDVFVNNAGIFHHPHQLTKDGFELIIGTNYLGTYYLCEKVLPIIEKWNREVVYINTISIVHRSAHVNLEKFYSNRNAYSRSKLCLARYTNHLIEKYKDSNIKIYMNHPGISATPIASSIFGGLHTLAKIFPINSAEKSSLSVAWILANDVPAGSVVGPNKFIAGGWGYPEINKKCKRASQDIEPLLEFSAKEISRVHS